MAEADPKIEAAGGSAEAAPDYAALAGEAPAAAAAVAARAKLIAKADDLEAIGKAVEDAASVSGGIWLSYLFFLFYLGVAVGGVTHRDLFLENPVKLPVLNVDLPLVAFFFLAPILFLVAHAYTLMHFVLLTKKARSFHQALLKQFPDSLETREGLRRQLPSNIFVQILDLETPYPD